MRRENGRVREEREEEWGSKFDERKGGGRGGTREGKRGGRE